MAAPLFLSDPRQAIAQGMSPPMSPQGPMAQPDAQGPQGMTMADIAQAFAPLLQQAQQEQGPLQRPVPPSRNPLEAFVGALASNMASALTRNPSFAQNYAEKMQREDSDRKAIENQNYMQDLVFNKEKHAELFALRGKALEAQIEAAQKNGEIEKTASLGQALEKLKQQGEKALKVEEGKQRMNEIGAQGKNAIEVAKIGANAKVTAANPDAGDTSWLGSYTKTTRSGHKFLDMSELTGKAHEAAIHYAAAQGIPAVSAADVSQLQDIDAARGNVEKILGQLEGLLPKNAQDRIASYPGIRLGALLQSSAQRSAFSSWRGAAIRNFRAVAGSKGLRLNQKEIDLAVKNEIPQITDTYAVAKRKMDNVLAGFDNAEAPILKQNWGADGGATGATQADRDYVKSLGIK